MGSPLYEIRIQVCHPMSDLDLGHEYGPRIWVVTTLIFEKDVKGNPSTSNQQYDLLLSTKWKNSPKASPPNTAFPGGIPTSSMASTSLIARNKFNHWGFPFFLGSSSCQPETTRLKVTKFQKSCSLENAFNMLFHPCFQPSFLHSSF